MVNATEMRPCFVIFQIALAIGFSLFTFHFSLFVFHFSFFTFPLKRLGLNGASLFLPFYLLTFKKPFYLFTFKMTFCYFFRLFA